MQRSTLEQAVKGVGDISGLIMGMGIVSVAFFVVDVHRYFDRLIDNHVKQKIQRVKEQVELKKLETTNRRSGGTL